MDETVCGWQKSTEADVVVWRNVTNQRVGKAQRAHSLLLWNSRRVGTLRFAHRLLLIR